VRLEVVHRTLLTYAQPVAETHMEMRVRPLNGSGQACLSFELEVEPASDVRSYLDGFGNNVHYFDHIPPHRQVQVTSRSLVETAAGVAGPDGLLLDDYLQFRSPVLDVFGVRQLAERFRPGEADVGPALERLTHHIHQAFVYRPETTDVYTAVDEVLRQRQGVCQDFAHLFVAVCRRMEVPARYVSGYIHSGVGRVGAGASHAWAEAWDPGQGWVGYDPTNPVHASEQHIRVAVGRDYLDVAPTRGTYVGAARENMEVEVRTSVVG
jgi:transglutaminase-like putative cysteine protease